MEQLGPIIFLALVFLGLVVFSMFQKVGEANNEVRERKALRKKRESWSPPPYHATNVEQLVASTSTEASESHLPSIAQAPKDTRAQLEKVFLCYLIWDKRIIGKPHPNLSEAHEYGFDWVQEQKAATVEKLREFVSYGGDRLSAMWGTRHHSFALQVMSLVDFGEVEERLNVHAFSVLADQFALCSVDVSEFTEAQWNLFFDNPDAMPDLESHLTPINLDFSDVSSMRDYVRAAGPREELFDF